MECNPRMTRTTCTATTSPALEFSAEDAVAPLPMPNQTSATKGWKIRVCYTLRGATFYKNLPRTLPEHGDLADWTAPGPVHSWLRERLIEAGIPFKSVEHITADRKGFSESADCLLEHLPMTHEEIEACK
jgi:hypothetical protein